MGRYSTRSGYKTGVWSASLRDCPTRVLVFQSGRLYKLLSRNFKNRSMITVGNYRAARSDWKTGFFRNTGWAKVAPPRLDAHKPCNLYGPCELNDLLHEIHLAVLVMHKNCHGPYMVDVVPSRLLEHKRQPSDCSE